MISFPCPHCGTTIEVPDQFQGKTEVCSHCGELVSVPSEAAPAEGSGAFASITGPAPFAAGGHRSEELWSSYGRDALFLAVLSCLLLVIACVLPGLGVILASIVGLIAAIMAIRAMVMAGSRSGKGLAFAIVALLLSLIPLGMGALALLGMMIALVR